jgi:hypothetical protein
VLLLQAALQQCVGQLQQLSTAWGGASAGSEQQLVKCADVLNYQGLRGLWCLPCLFYDHRFQSSQDPQQWWIVHLHCWQVQLQLQSNWIGRFGIYMPVLENVSDCVAPFPKVTPAVVQHGANGLQRCRSGTLWESVMRFMACKPVSCAATWVATSMHHVAHITVMHGGYLLVASVTTMRM